MKKSSVPHARAHAREAEAPEPTITYSRSIKLAVPVGAKLTLGHLAELQRQARERGYDDDAQVSVFDYRSISSSMYMISNLRLEIIVGDDR